MKKLSILTTIAIFLGFLVILVWAGASAAAPPQLKGEYAFTGEGACLNAPFGFNPDLSPVDGKVYSLSHSVQGVRTFNGDGTGTVQGMAVTIVPPPTPGLPGINFPPNASSHEFSFQFTYHITKDGMITTQMVPGTYIGTWLTGTLAGQTYTIDQFSLSGMASNDKKVLTLATGTTEVETHTYSNGSIRPQICHRSRVLIWLGE
jgi:hypothetical protein